MTPGVHALLRVLLVVGAVHNRLVGVDFEEDVGEVAHVRVEDVDRLEMIVPSP
jgi:hypothetical protein